MVHKADFCCPRRRYQVACEAKFLGSGNADSLRPDDRPAISGNKADADMGIAYTRPLRREDYIANKGKGGTKANGMAVQAAGQRLLYVKKRENYPFRHARSVIEETRISGIPREVIKVATGREHLARNRQHHDIRVRIPLHKPQRLDQFVVQFQIDRVHRFWTIENDAQEPAFAFHHDGFERWYRSNFLCHSILP